MSRVIDDLAAGGSEVLEAIAGAHAKARARVHAAGGGPRATGLVAVDIDATLITAHSEKEDARPNCRHGFGHHPVLAFLDHGEVGTGEALAGLLRPGNATANNAADLLTILDLGWRSYRRPFDTGCSSAVMLVATLAHMTTGAPIA